ncbi:MAG: hypothetical protein WBG01_10080 [Bacteroidota bacterium]
MKVLIIHFRSAPTEEKIPTRNHEKGGELDSAGTDGVSLEMKKRRAVLEEMGHQVAICSAYDWAEYPLPALEFDSDETRTMMRNLFEQMDAYSSEEDLERAFRLSADMLKESLGKVIRQSSPDTIFVHNVLCLPIHPAATVALSEVLQESGIPCTAIHHDILSEGAYKFNPTCGFARTMLDAHFPPTLPNLSHWTINSRNKAALAIRGVIAEVIHDTMDFDNLLDDTERKRLRSKLRAKYGIQPNDVVLFVGARIVPNKRTEIAGQITATLQKMAKDLLEAKLYNGNTFTRKSKFILLLAGRPEAAFLDYRNKLTEDFNSLKIHWKYVGDDVRPLRSEEQDLYALYPDIHLVADFVLYPTGWEGFGNQLLEAFASRVPTAVFEYPVFKEDIGPKEPKVVSLGDLVITRPDGLVELPTLVLKRAVYEILEILANAEEYREIADQNIEVGKEHFGFDVLRAHLTKSLDWAKSFRTI